MNTAEIIQQIRAAGLYPIPVEADAAPDEWSGLRFAGSLDEFFNAAKAMGATVVFLLIRKLEEEDFCHEPDASAEGALDGNEADANEAPIVEEISDLTATLPSLADFKKRIGEEYAYILAARGQMGVLSYVEAEDWWRSFNEQRDLAIGKLQEKCEAVREAAEERQLQKNESLFQQLPSLLDDPDFRNITTQRGMK